MMICKVTFQRGLHLPLVNICSLLKTIVSIPKVIFL